MVLAGWIMLGLFALFMVGASAVPKLMGMEAATKSFENLGWPQTFVLPIGILELVLTILVLIPRTSLLGGILMMALLGGAMASNLRAEMPLYSHSLFSVYLGVFMWIAIWLRSPELRSALLANFI